MSSNQILFGLGLVLVLAVSSQLLARGLGLPAIVVLLPAGFLAGMATDDVHPEGLLGDLYQPFVSLAVGIILFEAGLRLSFGEVALGVHRVVMRLVAVGIVVTCVSVAATVALLFGDMDSGVAVLIGAILVVSGPTVVLPLLAFIRPTREVRSLLKWEGVLVDPFGALLGVLVFTAVQSGGWQPGEMLVSVVTGALVGAIGATLLWLLLREVQRHAPEMAVAVTLMVVVAAVVAADLIREDSGFVAATLMGISLGNQRLLAPSRRIDISLTLEFEETLVQLLIGVLFVLIAASVSPSDVRAVMPEALVLLAVMVLLVRPAAVALATWRSTFTWRQRAFVGWMAPRGIVAGATASAFGVQLTQDGIAGADRILPIVFVAIFGTVIIYGLTAPLAARMLGVAGKERGLVLLVGGHPWARDLAAALKRSGVAVRMWVGPAGDREAARAAGIDADRGRIMLDAANREAELEEFTDALFLTRSDDFNAVAAADLRDELGHAHVYRVAPDPEEPGLLPPSIETGILGSSALTFAELSRLFAEGARFVNRSGDENARPDATQTEVPLVVVGAEGRLRFVTEGLAPDPQSGDTVIHLALAGTRSA
jgi:NhaP-type Na+/H+ or K+/H+ antiporter